MKTIFIALLFSFPLIVFSQQKTSTKKYNDSQNMEVKTNQEAHYPKGDSELFMYIHKNLKFPPETKGVRIEGEVMLSLFVNTDSTLSNIKVISGVGYGVDEAVVKILSPLKFAPCIQNGTKVKSNIMLNIPVFKRAED